MSGRDDARTSASGECRERENVNPNASFTVYTRDSTDTDTAAEHRSAPRRAAAAPGPVRSAPAGATDITHATILNDTATDTARAKAPTDPAVSDGAPASGHGLPASPETAATLAARRATRRRRFAWFFGVLAIVALGAALYWFIVGRFSEETDDAYVAGNVVQIAAQIQGTVTDVLVADTQQVKAGQALVRLDDAEAAAAFAQAQAQLAQAVRQVANTRLSMQTYEQTVKAREADLKLAQQAYRARAGASVEVVAPEELARAKSSLANAQAALAGAQAQREAARALGSERPVGQNPAVQQAAAQFKLAYRNLKRTTIVSPVDGTVGQRSVQIGQQVGPGVPLMSVVQLRQVWVEANFKEGQLRHMRVGQPVRLESDLYGARVTYHGRVEGFSAGTGSAFSMLPSQNAAGNWIKEGQLRHMRVGQPVRLESDLYGARVTYHGRVEGFSAGTGSAFSMLPSQNAAGNWIKVVQRLPVVISLEPSELAAHPLRVGLSMRATVQTKARGGHLLDGDAPLPAQRTRVHEMHAGEAEAAAEAVIRANDGGQ
ncbi:multidrug resistance secretion protein [Burkholderia pseudomallei]|nr:multidrug resistance secretion protein [Burkholderia pseudomallei]